MMNYVYTKDPITQAALSVFNPINGHLSNGERVLLLLSGGSNVKVARDLDKMLHGIKLSNLYVSVMDERFGPVGHPNENWQQLIDAGFNLPNANIYRPLTGQDIEKTTHDFNEWLVEQLKKADYKIGLFGIGSDGHTAGIKPNSPAVTSTQLATSYLGGDFERITISCDTISQMDEAVVQVSGPDKISALHTLLYTDTSQNEQPAQVIKTIPTVTIFSTNHKEEIK